MPGSVLLERVGIVGAVLLLVALPTALHGWPTSPSGNVFTALLIAGGCALAGWRAYPRVSTTLALCLFLATSFFPGWYPDPAVVLLGAAFVLLALAWRGRAAWVAGVSVLLYVTALAVLTGTADVVPILMFSVPPFIAGTVLRLRRETAQQLALRARELEEERELHAQIAVRHERARIASELHDIVGHAISVMVVQAAAGRRLTEIDPVRAAAAFAAISESAEEGRQDLARLVDLLSRGEADPDGVQDLALIDEIVDRATRSGLRITCRFEGDRLDLPTPIAQLAFRVVQEGLTNVLRHAPGAVVRITVASERSGVDVRVENEPGTAGGLPIRGTGRGLAGLRDRVIAKGGHLHAGPTPQGGWLVEARLPGPPAMTPPYRPGPSRSMRTA